MSHARHCSSAGGWRVTGAELRVGSVAWPRCPGAEAAASTRVGPADHRRAGPPRSWPGAAPTSTCSWWARARAGPVRRLLLGSTSSTSCAGPLPVLVVPRTVAAAAVDEGPSPTRRRGERAPHTPAAHADGGGDRGRRGARLAGRGDAADAAWAAAAIALVPLTWSVGRSLARRDVGVDLIALLAIAAALVLGEYLAAAVVALMSGGTTLEALAARRAARAHPPLARPPHDPPATGGPWWRCRSRRSSWATWSSCGRARSCRWTASW